MKKLKTYESFEPEEEWEEEVTIEPNTVYLVDKEDWEDFSDLIEEYGYKWADHRNIKSMNPFFLDLHQSRTLPVVNKIYVLINTERFKNRGKGVVTYSSKFSSIDSIIKMYDMNVKKF